MTTQENQANVDNLSDIRHPSDSQHGSSEIVKFFTGSKVLVTGATGFIGKLLVEKLLRSCPDISKLYLTVREKKGKSCDQRFDELFNDIIYERLKKEQPNFRNKVVMIHSDASLENLGLSPEDEKCLSDVNVIFHAAANVRFDVSLRVAINTNVRGVKQLLLFAKGLPNLKAFVYISTAYSYCVQKQIDEKHYKPPMDGDNLLTMLDILDDDKISKITSTLIAPWPNTYAFSKAIAENIVLKYSTGIPSCIVRPSIVTSTSVEPIPGWINNIYGFTGVVAASGVGLMRTLHAVPENVADIIPADYVISNIIAAAWDVANTSKSIPENIAHSVSDTELSDVEKVPIYNSVSCCQNPITWGHLMTLGMELSMELPTMKSIWYTSLILMRYGCINDILQFLLHIIPAIIVDTLCYITRRKPVLLDAYRKIHKFSSVIHYFSTNQWIFRNEAVMKLWQKLGRADREIFNFNMGNLVWEEYIYIYVKGLRTYLVDDPITTLEVARARQRKLKIAHYTLLTVASLLLLWGFVSLFFYVSSFFH